MQQGSMRAGWSAMLDALRALFDPIGVTPDGALYAAPPAARPDSSPPPSFADRPRRLQAAVVCRPAGLRLFASADRGDPRVRRVAMYSDVALPVGERLELEVFANGESATLTGKVARVESLDAGHRARFDIIFDVTRIDARAADKLVGLLA